jgi:hypothetical protein
VGAALCGNKEIFNQDRDSRLISTFSDQGFESAKKVETEQRIRCSIAFFKISNSFMVAFQGVDMSDTGCRM